MGPIWPYTIVLTYFMRFLKYFISNMYIRTTLFCLNSCNILPQFSHQAVEEVRYQNICLFSLLISKGVNFLQFKYKFKGTIITYVWQKGLLHPKVSQIKCYMFLNTPCPILWNKCSMPMVVTYLGHYIQHVYNTQLQWIQCFVKISNAVPKTGCQEWTNVTWHQ